ncbi:MAG TPA: alpha/beta fold hydrolase [Anaerolineae bacterium]|nr:alpha/beta fold hydrolase [Anaerolineae bacterium]
MTLTKQIRIKPVRFAARGDDGIELEGALHYLEGEGQWPAAVVCHPHPMGGGTMNNSIVAAIARALVERGIVALRFNFRGVGKSGGRHEGGRGELADVAGAIDWLLAQPSVDPWRVGLAGFSFGAAVALHVAARDPRVVGLAAVGLPADRIDPAVAATLTRPKFFITGELDHLAPPGPLRRLVEELPPPKEIEIVPGADHFFRDREDEAAARVAGFLAGL